jgi:hypothetical protein
VFVGQHHPAGLRLNDLDLHPDQAAGRAAKAGVVGDELVLRRGGEHRNAVSILTPQKTEQMQKIIKKMFLDVPVCAGITHRINLGHGRDDGSASPPGRWSKLGASPWCNLSW